MMRFLTHSTEQTEALAAFLAPHLVRGDILLLGGGLGAGKTAFVRGLVRGLEGEQDDVSSPTFALMNQYSAKLTVYHFDLYRLSCADDVYDAGFDEIFRSGEGICAVEWHSVAGDIWTDLRVTHITLEGEDDERTITVEDMDDIDDFGCLIQRGIGVLNP